MFPDLDKQEEQKWIGQFLREMQTVTWHFETNAKCCCWSGVPGDTKLGWVLLEERSTREIEVNRERVRENMRERHAVGWYSWESLQLLQYLELSWGQIPHGIERKPVEVERAFWRNVSHQMEIFCSCSPSFNVVLYMVFHLILNKQTILLSPGLFRESWFRSLLCRSCIVLKVFTSWSELFQVFQAPKTNSKQTIFWPNFVWNCFTPEHSSISLEV